MWKSLFFTALVARLACAQANASTAQAFVPVTPCRVADTRNATGPFGGPELIPGQTRTIVIPNSLCGIPATATAYSVNVTAIPAGRLNGLTIWPTGQAQPLLSTLNSSTYGAIVANAAIVAAGTNGAISVYVTDPTQVVLDINGYFAPVPAPPGPAQVGTLAAMPAACGAGALYVAMDQMTGQQLYICENGTWAQLFVPGPSGAVNMTNGALDIVTAVVPRKMSANSWSGLNDFQFLQVDPSTMPPSCASPASDLGRIWIDSTDSNNTGFKVCLAVAGKLQWVVK